MAVCAWPHRLAVSDDAVRLAVIGKLGWIKRQRARFEAQPRQSEREMSPARATISSGRRYRLNVIEHASDLRECRCAIATTLDLLVRARSDRVRAKGSSSLGVGES